MRKTVVTLLMVVSFAISGLGFAATASASSHDDPNCDKVRGTIICTYSEPVGNSGKTKTSTESQKGSFNSSHDPDCTYTNPSGNQPAGKQGC